MENPHPPKPTERNLPSSTASRTLALRSDPEGGKRLALELHDRFHAMKTYGKEPESLRSIIAVFARDLAEFPIDTVLQAIRTHAHRSQEFPTVFDLVNLIKRDGRPPLLESQYVTICKKDGQDRTAEEWRYKREYEAERDTGWGQRSDPTKKAHLQAENRNLRMKLQNLETEHKRLAGLFQEEKTRKTPARPELTILEKTQRTVDHMKDEGVPQETIDEFISQQPVR